MPRGHFDRTARKARTRAQLLEAAAHIYARRGFAGATLEEVASEAGYTKGAVYAHFGSRENLLLALLEEHLASEIAEQLELFDRARVTWERPFAGSERWMEGLQEHPDRFRLFVELWGYAQREEPMRLRLASGLAQLRATFTHFAADSAADAQIETSPEANEQFATVMLGLGLGLGMLELTDPPTVPSQLLGAVLSVLIRALEDSPEARELLAQVRGEHPGAPGEYPEVRGERSEAGSERPQVRSERSA
jgi:AcrR family transcriptional regulator